MGNSDSQYQPQQYYQQQPRQAPPQQYYQQPSQQRQQAPPQQYYQQPPQQRQQPPVQDQYIDPYRQNVSNDQNYSNPNRGIVNIRNDPIRYGGQNDYNYQIQPIMAKSLDMFNVNETIKNIDELEKKELDNFNRLEKQRRRRFENEQKTRRDRLNNMISQFEQKYNPYSILGLDRDCNARQAKVNYRKLALKYHPDKNGGKTDYEFKLITQSYYYILNKLENQNKHQTKMNQDVVFQQYEDNVNEQKYNVHLDKDNFDISKFNKIFDQYKISSAYDSGYGDLMKGGPRSEKDVELTDNQMVFGRKFNKEVFNSSFDKMKANKTSDIVEYQEPIALQSGASSCVELGVGEIDNFGGGSGGLGYTDYKQAHYDNNMININNVKIKQYKNIKDLQHARSKLSYIMSEQDKELERIREYKKQQEEQNRQNRLQEHDSHMYSQYNKLNQLLIKQ
jgi:curved DNA-binding protein CbpA